MGGARDLDRDHLARAAGRPAPARDQRGCVCDGGKYHLHLIINSIHNFEGLLVIHVYNAGMMVAALIIPFLHRFGQNTAAIFLLILLIGGNSFVVWMLGTASGLEIYFTLAGAILLLFGVENWKLFLPFLAATAAALLLVLNLAPPNGLIQPDDQDLRTMLFGQAMINASASTRSSCSMHWLRCTAPRRS